MLALAGFITLLSSCSGGDNGSGNTPDGGDDTDTGDPPAQWTVEQVEDANVGLQADLVTSPEGGLGLAYWSNESYEDGPCDEILVDPPTRLRQELRFATWSPGDQSWQTELIDAPVVAFGATGVSLAYNPNGDPAVAFTGGDPQMQFCGSNNAVLGVRGDSGWAFDTASSESGDSATGDPASDAGFVVGFWPALAYAPDGEPAIAHKDVHFGALQSDDFRRADAEFASRAGGGWGHEAIDYGDGAGDSNELIFDAVGRPVAFFAIPLDSQTESRHGVWASRRTTEGDWESVKLHAGAIHQEISAGVHPDSGDLVVAFYSASDYAVRLRKLSDPESFTDSTAWSSEFVCKPQYDEGRHVSLAFSPDGRIALAYHRCRLLSSSSDGCDQNEEGVVFAIEDGSDWDIETAATGEIGSCGEYASLAFDAQGTAHIAYRCTVETPSDYTFRLFVASKPIEDQE